MAQIASDLENNHTGRKISTMAIRLGFLIEIFLTVTIRTAALTHFLPSSRHRLQSRRLGKKLVWTCCLHSSHTTFSCMHYRKCLFLQDSWCFQLMAPYSDMPHRLAEACKLCHNDSSFPRRFYLFWQHIQRHREDYNCCLRR